jgi:drug/metabolite transporter (DMT)-like permease
LRRPVLALLLVTLVWGATFPVLKVATAQLSGVEVCALRFALAGVCLLPWAWRALPGAWADGAWLGTLVLVSYVAQAYGLETISSNRSAFLTSLNVLMVPLFGMALGQPLVARVLAAAALACAGLALMSWDGGANWRADVATVAGAAAFACYVMALSRRAARHAPLSLAATQMVCMGLLGLLWMLLDTPSARLQTLPARLNPEILAGLVYLGVVASALMLWLQAWAQREVVAEQAAIIYAMEPVFAALFGWLWLAETLTLRAACGAAVVLAALLLSEYKAASD